MKVIITLTISLLPLLCTGLARAQLVGNCTLYVSPGGGGKGLTPGSPTTLALANKASVAGSVICLKGGTYNLAATFSPTHGGTSSKYITWEAYGDSPANFVWTGGSDRNDGRGRQMIAANSKSYLKFIGFNMDGLQFGNQGILCNTCDHIVYQNLYVKNLIYSGLSCPRCDYVTFDHNMVWHVGENPHGLTTVGINAGSGLTMKASLFDSYPGLHNVFSGNIISGQFDPTSVHTDGNGISLDLTSQPTSGVTLVVNNVIYGNGGRCVYVNSAPPNFWTNTIVANNTCYKNSLDSTQHAVRANFIDHNSINTHFINNISYAWAGWAGNIPNHSLSASPTGTTFNKELWFGGIEGAPDTAEFIHRDPLFLNPPVYDNKADGQYANSIDPKTLGSAFGLQSGSPAIGAGIDPTTVAGISTQAASDMAPWVYVDINGAPRPRGGRFDLGAYNK
jgi:hypothetical protein